MIDLLESTKERLTLPIGDARRKLLIILNFSYTILVPVFLVSEKIATGSFVPNPVLYLVYIPAVFLNLASAIYNVIFFIRRRKQIGIGKTGSTEYTYGRQNFLDQLFGWASILPIMIMSFCNMTGVGNPSNDAILTDFALGHNLLIGAVLIIGRKTAVVWCLVVISVLFWNVSKAGWDYEYHYLTPIEASKYKEDLRKKEPTALVRQAELSANGLNPPKITRYFNTWLVFIIISFVGAYYFSGITIDIFKIIPSVLDDIQLAIENNKRMDIELEHREKEITKSAMRIVRYNEILEDLNTEIEKLEYKDKKNLIGVISRIRKALNKEADWENFETKFDSIHNDFFKTIQKKYPNLTQAELKHLAYIRMNLSSAEISNLMEVKTESLRTLRYRLKKKLNLNEDIDLRDFTCNIELID